MATAKVTVTVPADQLNAIRDLVAAGGARSVSGFVQHAILTALEEVTGWQALLAEALESSGGPPTEAERQWADQVLSGSPAPQGAATQSEQRAGIDPAA